MLDDWTGEACHALTIDRGLVDVTALLDLARDTAHGVARPAAPLTTYLVGLAVGQGMPLDEAISSVRALLSRWPPAEPAPTE